MAIIVKLWPFPDLYIQLVFIYCVDNLMHHSVHPLVRVTPNQHLATTRSWMTSFISSPYGPVGKLRVWDTWVCGESWLAVKDLQPAAPVFKGWASRCPLGIVQHVQNNPLYKNLCNSMTTLTLELKPFVQLIRLQNLLFNGFVSMETV